MKYWKLNVSFPARRYPRIPDIVLPKHNTVICINGCFWHVHTNCKYSTIPKTRTDFWTNKLNGNVEREKLIIKELEHLGWKVIIVWECELKSDPGDRLIRLLEEIRGSCYE